MESVRALKRRQGFGVLVLAAVFIGMLILPAGAHAKKKSDIITLPWSNPAKKPKSPSFVLPAQNRWGCLACHANKSLSKFRGKREVSLFVDPEIIGGSMHERIACIDCHTDFSYEKHPAENPKNFRQVAGLACMKCHPFQSYLYKKSTHGELALQGKLGKIDDKPTESALCSSCHGFHDIQSPRFEPYKSEFRASSKRICGKCHTDRYDSYSDYYHGQAYKNKAKDAPACWDCHRKHRVVKKDQDPDKDPDQEQPTSSITEANLPRTCGKCHDRPGSGLVSYAPMIHGRQAALDNNIIYKIVSIFIKREEVATKSKGQEPVKRLEVVTQSKEEGFLMRVYDFFFPKSLRPVTED